jgi:hypothetical protein
MLGLGGQNPMQFIEKYSNGHSSMAIGAVVCQLCMLISSGLSGFGYTMHVFILFLISSYLSKQATI